jgi:hypothetical protein
MKQLLTERENDQRFHRALGNSKALKIGLETNVLKSSLPGVSLDPRFSVKDPGSDVVYVRHPATDNGIDLTAHFLELPENSEPLILTFAALPASINGLFQRLNFRQLPDLPILGLEFGRFPSEHAEEKQTLLAGILEKKGKVDQYFNLDCLSRSKVWNPLFAKYHYSVVPSQMDFEFGYLKVDATRNNLGEIVVTVSRVSQSEIPEILKNAPTFPR